MATPTRRVEGLQHQFFLNAFGLCSFSAAGVRAWVYSQYVHQRNDSSEQSRNVGYTQSTVNTVKALASMALNPRTC